MSQLFARLKPYDPDNGCHLRTLSLPGLKDKMGDGNTTFGLDTWVGVTPEVAEILDEIKQPGSKTIKAFDIVDDEGRQAVELGPKFQIPKGFKLARAESVLPAPPPGFKFVPENEPEPPPPAATAESKTKKMVTPKKQTTAPAPVIPPPPAAPAAQGDEKAEF